MADLLRLASWRLVTTYRSRIGGYLAIVVLVGLMGGLAMGAIAGARTTQTSFRVYLTSTNPSETVVSIAFRDPQLGSSVGYAPRIERTLASLRFVKHSADIIGFDGNLNVLSRVHGNAGSGGKPAAFEGSLNGEYLTQDRLTIVQGRMAVPSRTDEFIMSADAVAAAGMHVGSTIRLGFYTDVQENTANCCSVPTKPHVDITLRLVGIFVASNQIVQDDVEKLGSQLAVLTPTLTRQLATCCAYYSALALQLTGGTRHEAAVLAEAKRLLPGDQLLSTSPGAAFAASKADRVIRPDAIAMGAFGILVAVAALLIGGQVVGRMVRRSAQDARILRDLGAGPGMTLADALFGVIGAVVLGAGLAAAVAIGLSPLAPIGPVRPYFPNRGVSVDATVLEIGFCLVVMAFTAIAIVVAVAIAPHRGETRRVRNARRRSSTARVAVACGLSPAVIAGVRSALDSDAGRGAVPVRSTIVGAVLAVFVIVTTATFGSSLNNLVSHPALYGWNWNYVMLAGFAGDEDLPSAQASSMLSRDHSVSSWTGVYFEAVMLDGQTVPALASSPNAAIGPTLLAGHSMQSPNQVVLGSVTLSRLHKDVGDFVLASNGGPPTRRLQIVGVATMPTIGAGGSAGLQMGIGALVSSSIYPASLLNPQQSSVPGPNAYLIRIRPGVSPAAALASLNQINRTLLAGPDGAGGVVSILRPAEIADYRSLESTPLLLAGVLAAGAIGALGLTLVASVRSRRREFALLKTLGFTRRQLWVTVAWQSTVIAVVGLAIGMPVGIAFGRWLWTEFAQQISAVPHPTVPLTSMALVLLIGLAFANVVAAIPGRIAARTPAALLLRSE